MPFAASTSHVSCAYTSERKRLSYPTMAAFGSEREFQWSAVACAMRRTFSKVKSSAMTPRQPSVPNLMGVFCMLSQFLDRGRQVQPLVPEQRRTGDEHISARLDTTPA